MQFVLTDTGIALFNNAKQLGTKMDASTFVLKGATVDAPYSPSSSATSMQGTITITKPIRMYYSDGLSLDLISIVNPSDASAEFQEFGLFSDIGSLLAIYCSQTSYKHFQEGSSLGTRYKLRVELNLPYWPGHAISVANLENAQNEWSKKTALPLIITGVDSFRVPGYHGKTFENGRRVSLVPASTTEPGGGAVTLVQSSSYDLVGDYTTVVTANKHGYSNGPAFYWLGTFTGGYNNAVSCPAIQLFQQTLNGNWQIPSGYNAASMHMALQGNVDVSAGSMWKILA